MNSTVLTITLDERGCSVEGPITDKMICYSMLELAKDAIRKASDDAYAKEANGQGNIIKPPPGLRIT